MKILKILSAFLGVNPHFTQWFFKSGDVNGALLWASELGQLRLVNLLINGGANLQCKDREGVYCYEDLSWGDIGYHKRASRSFELLTLELNEIFNQKC